MTTKILSEPKKDCFAYSDEKNNCKALDRFWCRLGKCRFYKTKEERCEGCKNTRALITCTECKQLGLK